jgi:hypothetical protein
MSSRKNRPKCSPNHLLLKFIHELNCGTKLPEKFGLLLYFSKICPK